MTNANTFSGRLQSNGVWLPFVLAGIITAGITLARPAFGATGDPCDLAAAAQQANISGGCQASCPGSAFDASSVLGKNPCAAETTNKKCCVQTGNDACKWAAAKKGGVKDTSKVTCVAAGNEQSYSKEIMGTLNSCGSSSKCRDELPSCADAFVKIGQSVLAKCAFDEAQAKAVFGVGSYPFDATSLLKLAKASYTCPADYECWANAPASGSLCAKLGELRGVQGAVCSLSILGAGAGQGGCDQLAGNDPKYAGYANLMDGVSPKLDANPCPGIGTVPGVINYCCGPAAKGGTPGAGAAATSTKQTKQAPPATVTKFGLINPLGTRSIPQILGQVVQWLGAMAGSLFFAFLLWGGVQWMTAGGDAAKVKSAQQRIVASVTGIVVVLLAYLIVESIVGVLVFK